MAFRLDNVVPWGRTFEEYRQMFMLDEADMQAKILDFGAGPSSFNFQARQKGIEVISLDPIYEFNKQEIKKRIDEASVTVMKQMQDNYDNYLWDKIKNLNELKKLRMSAMELFLSDYENGKKEKRYICYSLPERLMFEDNSFEIGLSSHFLLMYTALGYDFHIKAISEMLRVCKEIRIFPLLDLNSERSDLTDNVIKYFKARCSLKIKETDYEFQKGGNKLLVIKK